MAAPGEVSQLPRRQERNQQWQWHKTIIERQSRALTNNRTAPAVSKMIEQLAGDWIDERPNHAGYTQRYHLTVTDGRVHVDTYLDPWKLHETASRSSPNLIHVLSDGAGESVVWRGSNRISYKLHLRHWSHAPGKGTEILKIAWVPQGLHARGWTYVWRRLTQSEAIVPRIWEQKDRVSRAGLVACERNGSLDIHQQEIATLHALLEEGCTLPSVDSIHPLHVCTGSAE